MIQKALAVLLLLTGMLPCGAPPCLAQAAEQLVWWPLVTDGKDYRRVPYPQEAGPLHVLADSEIVIEARRAPVSWWPITREYLADFSNSPPSVDGEVEIVDPSGKVRMIEPGPYVLWHPAGVGAGPVELVHGDGTEAFYRDYVARARAAAAREREYQRIVGLHQAAVEAWLRMAAERRGKNMPPPPPELAIDRPEPFHAFATEPAEAAVLALPAGDYTVRLRGPDGEIVRGSERALKSFGALDQGIGYVLRPEDRWTRPAVSFAPDETVYVSSATDLFFDPLPVVAYDAWSFTHLFDPQTVETNAARTVWVPDPVRAEPDNAALGLWHGDALQKTLPRMPWRVAQLTGAARGYEIQPFDEDDSPLEPDFDAMRLPERADVTRVGLLAGDAPVPASSRAVRRVALWPELLLFLPALLPLAVGLLLRIGWRHRFG